MMGDIFINDEYIVAQSVNDDFPKFIHTSIMMRMMMTVLGDKETMKSANDEMRYCRCLIIEGERAKG